jgi:hypothetical protein
LRQGDDSSVKDHLYSKKFEFEVERILALSLNSILLNVDDPALLFRRTLDYENIPSLAMPQMNMFSGFSPQHQVSLHMGDSSQLLGNKFSFENIDEKRHSKRIEIGLTRGSTFVNKGNNRFLKKVESVDSKKLSSGSD